MSAMKPPIGNEAKGEGQQVRYFSLNCQGDQGGGILPNETAANRSYDKLAICVDWLNEGAACVCLQDLGERCNSDVPAADFEDHLDEHTIYCAGEGANDGDPAGTVAIMVHRDWTVREVLRVPGSSRCIGVDMSRDGISILAVSVYLPPGMDKPLNMDAKRDSPVRPFRDASSALKRIGSWRLFEDGCASSKCS